MSHKFTNEFILNSIKEWFNDNIEILNDKNEILYTNSKLKCKCKIDGFEWETIYNLLKLKHGCPVCKIVNNRLNGSNERIGKMTYEMFICALKQLSQDDIELITLKEDFVYNSNYKLKFKCNKHNHEWEISGKAILKRPYCSLCEKERVIKKNGEEFLNKIHEKWPQIEFAEEYKGYETPIKFIDTITGEEFVRLPQTLRLRFEKDKESFKQLNENKLKKIQDYRKHITDYPLLELYPNLEPLLKDKEEIKNVLVKDGKNITLICPRCGAEKIVNTKYLKIFLEKDFKCDFCGKTGISYPNRFFKEFLDYLNNSINYFKNNPIDFKREYSPDWAGNYKYDFFFNFNNVDYYIELDGEQHYKPKFFMEKLKKNDETAEKMFKEIQERDKIKDNLVKENNGIIIRIDCSNTNKMKDNIINSELFKIFDSQSKQNKQNSIKHSIDWIEISNKAEENYILKIWKLYNDGKGKTVEEIAKELNISQATVVRNLSRGRNIGIVKETAEESHLKALKLANKKNRKPIKVFNLYTKETMYFNSGATFAQYLIDNDIDFEGKKRNSVGSRINLACRKGRKFHGYEVSYVTKEDIPKIKDKIMDYKPESEIYNK